MLTDPLAAAAARPVPHAPDALALLDDPQEWVAFSRPLASGPDLWESSVVIEGMHCAACAVAVESALAGVAGVLRAEVSAASHRARLVWSSTRAKPSDWMQALQRIGYRAVPANDLFASERRRRETRKALWRWLVAGFCMMQVMMYAYPAYTARPGDLTAEMEQLLRWASWVLTLPVLLFSCGPFFASALRDLRQRRIGMDLPVALGMAMTFAVSTAGTFEPAGPFGREVYFDSLTMFVFFLLSGRWLELRLRDRTAGALEALMNRLPDSVERRCADGSFERVAVRRLQPGDLLRVRPGEAIAADGRIEEGHTQVDEALLTGESRPLARAVGAQVVAGSHNLSATVLVRVEQVGAATRFAQIVALMESASTTKPQAVLLADRLARPFLLVVLFSAAAACAWWWDVDHERALMVAVAVLVVTCPCALSLATPAALLAAAGRLASGGVLVRRLQALEALARVDTMVFDKTGTLTSNTPALGDIRTRLGTTPAVALEMAAALAAHSLHPVSRALVQQAGLRRAQDPALAAAGTWTCEGASETPGQGVQGLVRPALWAAAPAVPLRLGSALFCSATPGTAPEVHLSDAAGWLATFGLREALRADVRAAVQALAQSGVDVRMLSGDRPDAAARVAAAAGIAHASGGCSPADKLQALAALQSQGRTVAMVGDGMNDTPVLAAAAVSFAFGQAVPLAQARADFVVPGDRLMAVVQTLQVSRKAMAVVRQNLLWALVYNAACIPLAMAGWLPAWLAGLGMAGSSLVVVLNALRISANAPQDA